MFSAQENDWKYFHKRSVLYSGASITSFYLSKKISPRDIMYILQYKRNDPRSIETLWNQLFTWLNKKKPLRVIEKDTKNKILVSKEIEKYSLKNKLTVVLYKKGNMTHSALIGGYTYGPNRKIKAFRMKDSATNREDLIDVNTFKSQFWNVEVYKVYIVVDK